MMLPAKKAARWECEREDRMRTRKKAKIGRRQSSYKVSLGSAGAQENGLHIEEIVG